jgi:hypothetical protein
MLAELSVLLVEESGGKHSAKTRSLPDVIYPRFATLCM